MPYAVLHSIARDVQSDRCCRAERANGGIAAVLISTSSTTIKSFGFLCALRERSRRPPRSKPLFSPSLAKIPNAEAAENPAEFAKKKPSDDPVHPCQHQPLEPTNEIFATIY
jgi:hypothetical protein